MNAVNLYLLTRVRDHETLSMLFQSLAGLPSFKMISPHEAACLCSLTQLLADHILKGDAAELPGRLSCLDGFFFSYVIEHIGKEFDLLKISSDGEYALNIELKSEDIGEERIKKQLEQNRYYLSHTAGTILSYTYVMDTAAFYCLNDRNHLRRCSVEEVASALARPALQDYLKQDIDRFFRSSDYLISPVAAPEKFLQGQYFLTNQQFDFRRRILEALPQDQPPVISITGSAGTGKTLLLFDLAMQLSRKSRVLLIHSGPLRQGHILIDERLKNVDILSADTACHEENLAGYACLMADEADHLSAAQLGMLLSYAAVHAVPVIFAYDPHRLLGTALPDSPAAGSDTLSLLENACTLSLAFSGNIRINRPVFTFLHTLLHLKDHAGHPDYSCIDVLYADNPEELKTLTGYYTGLGYEWIRHEAVRSADNTVIAQEYASVLIVLDENYFYDDSIHLRVRNEEDTALQLLYEGLSRTREKLCLIVKSNPPLFTAILQIRLHQLGKIT